MTGIPEHNSAREFDVSWFIISEISEALGDFQTFIWNTNFTGPQASLVFSLHGKIMS